MEVNFKSNKTKKTKYVYMLGVLIFGKALTGYYIWNKQTLKIAQTAKIIAAGVNCAGDLMLETEKDFWIGTCISPITVDTENTDTNKEPYYSTLYNNVN